MDGRTRNTNIFMKFARAVSKVFQPGGEIIQNPSGNHIWVKYKRNFIIRSGSFATVYHCRDKKTKHVFACKSIQKSRIASGEIPVQDIRQEVACMRSLPPHPNIVRLRDTYEGKNNIHLLMEMCDGGNLSIFIHNRAPYPENEAAKLIKDIIEAIQFCHSHGVMHRNVKPENFMFSGSGEHKVLKAIGFGFATKFTRGERFRESLGTPTHMAPEVYLGNYGAEADIWSAGVILYTLLSGTLPFVIAEGGAEGEAGLGELMKAVLVSKIDLVREPWTAVSSDAKSLVRGMLERNPSRRLDANRILSHRWFSRFEARRVSRSSVARGR